MKTRFQSYLPCAGYCKKRTVLKADLVKPQQPTSAFYVCTFCLQGSAFKFTEKQTVLQT